MQYVCLYACVTHYCTHRPFSRCLSAFVSFFIYVLRVLFHNYDFQTDVSHLAAKAGTVFCALLGFILHACLRFLLSSPCPPGCGVNLGMRGLESMGTFIYRTATAVDQNDMMEALSAKMQHSRQVAETFKQTGLAESMYE